MVTIHKAIGAVGSAGDAGCKSEMEVTRQARAFVEQKYNDKEAAVKAREAALEENARTLKQEMNDVRNEKDLETKELHVILRAKKEELSMSQAFQREMMTVFASARGEDLNLTKQCLELKTKMTESQLLAQAAESDKVKAEADGAERLKRAEELKGLVGDGETLNDQLQEKVELMSQNWQIHQDRGDSQVQALEDLHQASASSTKATALQISELQNTLEGLQSMIKQGSEALSREPRKLYNILDLELAVLLKG